MPAGRLASCLGMNTQTTTSKRNRPAGRRPTGRVRGSGCRALGGYRSLSRNCGCGGQALAGLPLVALHGFLESDGVVVAEEAHAAATVDAVGVIDAHHEAHVTVARTTPLLLGVKLAGRVGEVVAAVVGHER